MYQTSSNVSMTFSDVGWKQKWGLWWRIGEKIRILGINWGLDLIFKQITRPVSHESLKRKIWKEQNFQ